MNTGFRPSEIWQLRAVGDPRLSHDGGSLAVAVTIPDQETDAFTTAVDIVDLTLGLTTRVSAGPAADSPRWAPDGARLAYLSHQDGISVLHVYDKASTSTLSVSVGGHASNPQWSPDGRRIALTRSQTTREAKATEQTKPQVIESLHYRADGTGLRPERQQIIIVDLTAGSCAEVTDAGYLADHGTWSPDGAAIGYVADRRAGWQGRRERADLWVLDLTTGRERVLTGGLGPVRSPAFSPDGRWIAYLGHEHGSAADRHLRLYVVPSDSSAPPRPTSPDLDRSVGAQVPTGQQFVWLGDSDTLLFLVADRGTVAIARCRVSTGAAETLVAGYRQVDGLDVSHCGEMVAFTSQWPDSPSEAYLLRDGHLTPATSYNDEHQWRPWLVPIRPIEWAGADGTPLEGFVAYPRDWRPGAGFPLVLIVHGGPHGFHPYPASPPLTQSLAAAGFVVLLPNPRGSGGYGESFKRQVTRNWGTANLDDVVPLIDATVADGTADAGRLYLYGTSYGGYLTAFITTRTDRFRAAGIGAGIVNLLSALGTSDVTDYFLHEIGDPRIDQPEFISRSPVTAAANVSTPTLILHWDGDLRCPISQAEEWFTALALNDVPVRFVRYPGGSHTISTPSQQIDRLERLIDWFSHPPSRPENLAGEGLAL